MSILKIKDSDGNYITVPAIVGPPGATGATGPKGDKGDRGKDGTNIQVSNTAPTDSEVEVWINPSVQSDYETLNTSLNNVTNRVASLETNINNCITKGQIYVISGTTSQAPDSSGNVPLDNIPSDVYVLNFYPTSKVNIVAVPYFPGSGYTNWYCHIFASYEGAITNITSLSYRAVVYKP